MSTLFVSYSTKDAALALDVKHRLEERGYAGAFLDAHPEDGIPAGARWDEVLHRRMRLCRGVIVIRTPRSMQSRWCFAEIQLAKALNKHIFPLEMEPCEADSSLTDVQAVFPYRDGEEAYEKLWSGLERAGLQARSASSLPLGRSPYPGLATYDEADEAVFFGRGPETEDAIQALDLLQRLGAPNLVMVLGSSGSGKSSLVRAGIVPRLRRDRARWLVIGPMRPRGTPIETLDAAIEIAARENELQGVATGATVADRMLALGAAAFRDKGGAERAVVLVIDQLEELFTTGDRASCESFLEVLQTTLEGGKGRVFVLASVRTAFFNQVQAAPQLKGRAIRVLSLGRLPEERLADVIEQPARVAGIEIEPAVVGRMIQQCPTTDALPLIAFALWRMYEGSDKKHFKSADFGEALGRMERWIGALAEQLVGDLRDGHPRERALAALFLRFVKLVDVQGVEQVVREPILRKSIPGDLDSTVKQFEEHRLLTSDGDRVEVSHEALFRTWPRLSRWIEEHRGFLRWRRDTAARVAAHRGGHGDLLTGVALATARRFLDARPEALTDDEKKLIIASLHRQFCSRLALLVGAIVLIGGVGYGAYTPWAVERRKVEVDRKEVALAKQAVEVEKQSIDLAKQKAAEDTRRALVADFQQIELSSNVPADGGGSSDDALSRLLVLEQYARTRGVAPTPRPIRFREKVPFALVQHDGMVTALATSADGVRIASSDASGSTKIWRSDGHGRIASISTAGVAESLRFAPNGRRLFIGEGSGVSWVDLLEPDKLGKPTEIQIEGGVRSMALMDGHTLVVLTGRRAVLKIDALHPSRAQAVLSARPGRDLVGLYDWAYQDWSADGRRVVVVGLEDGAAEVVQVDPPLASPIVAHLVDPGQPIENASLSPDGQSVVTLSKDGHLLLWDVASREHRPLYRASSNLIWTLSATFSPDSSTVGVSTFHSGALLFHRTRGEGEREPFSALNVDGPRYSGTFGTKGHFFALAGIREDVVWTKLDAASTMVLPCLAMSGRWPWSSEQMRRSLKRPAVQFLPPPGPGWGIISAHGGNVVLWRPPLFPKPVPRNLTTWREVAEEVRQMTTVCLPPPRGGDKEAEKRFRICEVGYGRM